MRYMKWLSALGLLAMTIALANGFLRGDFAAEGDLIAGMPWGVVSLVDLYTGFALFSAWIIYREGPRPAALFWVAAMMVLGFWAGSLYMLLQAARSDGDWRAFWLGRQA